MMMHSNLAAFKIERRRVSVAVFVGERLDFTDSRQLPSIYAKALESASRYVDWVRRALRIEDAAVEESRSDPKTWRSRFTTEIIKQLRSIGVPVFEVEKDVLLASFAHPPLRYRTELRRVVASIWPILASKDKNAACIDAAALGLYVQVEKTFRSLNNQVTMLRG
jgi:hypothetical protein